MNVKKNDTVVVLSGKDKGKQGKVLSVNPQAGKVVVEGVSVATRHQKPRRQGEEGGIVKKETPIYASKVMTVCPKCSKAPTRSWTARRCACASTAALKSEKEEEYRKWLTPI